MCIQNTWHSILWLHSSSYDYMHFLLTIMHILTARDDVDLRGKKKALWRGIEPRSPASAHDRREY